MSTNNKGKLEQVLLVINVIPLLLFGAITLLLSYQWFSRAMYSEVQHELRYVAYNVDTLLDMVHPGDYILTGETALRLYKGDSDITSEYELIDRVKEDTDLEITVFYQDTRILTTIRNKDGQRIVGSGASDTVITDVLRGGQEKFYQNILINGSGYFSYYIPVHNSDGTITGMIFVGKPVAEVDAAVQKSLYPLIIATIATMIIISLFLFFYAKRLGDALRRIRIFLADVATGNLNAELDSIVTRRNDEFGDIGRSAVSMQNALRTLVEQDSLTELLNRRSADRKLKKIIQRYETQNMPFCLAIGDIDFFKKVNDTYGHACGDLILKNVAAKLREHMRNNGFAARWGGEEFLLVFDHMDSSDAYKILEKIRQDIRSMESRYEDETVKVTITFGLTTGNTTNMVTLLNRADDNLYRGKQSGRDRTIRDRVKEETHPEETSGEKEQATED